MLIAYTWRRLIIFCTINWAGWKFLLDIVLGGFSSFPWKSPLSKMIEPGIDRVSMHGKLTCSPAPKKHKFVSFTVVMGSDFGMQMQWVYWLCLQVHIINADYYANMLRKLGKAITSKHKSWWKWFCFISTQLQHINPWFQWLLCITFAFKCLITLPIYLIWISSVHQQENEIISVIMTTYLLLIMFWPMESKGLFSVPYVTLSGKKQCSY